MRKLLATLALVSAAVLIAPVVAAAKGEGGEVTAVLLCGQAGCNDPGGGSAELQPVADALLFNDAEPAAPAPIGDYYRFELRLEGGESIGGWYVPEAGMLNLAGRWLPAGAAVDARLRAAAEGIEPLVFEPTAVVVGGREVADVEPYLHLWDRFPAVDVPANAYDMPWREVTIRTARPTPWTDTEPTSRFNPQPHIGYVPQLDLLVRHGDWVRPSDDFRRAIEGDLGVAPPVQRGFPWAALAAGLAVAAATTALLLLAMGRRPGPRGAAGTGAAA
jgi:hypothetical protein